MATKNLAKKPTRRRDRKNIEKGFMLIIVFLCKVWYNIYDVAWHLSNYSVTSNHTKEKTQYDWRKVFGTTHENAWGTSAGWG